MNLAAGMGTAPVFLEAENNTTRKTMAMGVKISPSILANTTTLKHFAGILQDLPVG